MAGRVLPPTSQNNVLGEMVPGGGRVVDEQTLQQISNALQANTTANTNLGNAVGSLSNLVLGNSSGVAQLGGTTRGLQGQVNTINGTLAGLPSTFVTSITQVSTVSGDINFAGSSVTQGVVHLNHTFNFNCDGNPFLVTLPNPFPSGESFVIVTPTGAGQTLTLPSAVTIGVGNTIRVHSGVTTSGGGNSFDVLTTGSDVFNVAGATSFQINPLGSTAYVGVRLTSDGVSILYTEGYN